MSQIKITCEEASTICTKSQYGEASLAEKTKLNIHFMFCKTCRVFVKQNGQLSEMCSLVMEHQKTTETSLTEADKLKLKEQIKELEKRS